MSIADAFYRHHVSSDAAKVQNTAKKAPAEAVTPRLQELTQLPEPNLQTVRL